MKCIEINVCMEIAEKWRSASPEKKAGIRQRDEIELPPESSPKANDEFQRFLDEIRRKVKERGLTEEKLQEILNASDFLKIFYSNLCYSNPKGTTL